MSENRKQPATWDDYERGGRASSVGSGDSRVMWDDLERQRSGDDHGALSPNGRTGERRHGSHRMHRRSSVNLAVQRIREAGGVNSIDNFARSWQRAAGFFEITPVRPSFRVSEDHGDAGDYGRQDVEGTPTDNQRSLLRQAFEQEGRRASDNVIADEDHHDEPHETQALLAPPHDQAKDQTVSDRLRANRDESIFSIEPSLASPFGGSYGTNYGSLRSRVNESSMRHAGRLFKEQQMKGANEPDQGREPILVKQVEEDGHLINVIVGQSTLPQTIFNSTNVLIGVGLLSLPLALKYSGWLVGLVFFVFAALTTAYTAKLLAKCLDVDSSLITFADLAFVSFGPRARIATSILFTLELVATCVALVVLFGDSLDALIPGWGVIAWKVLCGVLLIPLGFLPLRLLSFTSVLGILCCFGIVLAVIIDGLIKPHTPGSLREPATTYLFPQNWTTIPLSFGLLMSPWGGHSVFPNIYRDMRHPYKYRKGVNVTYAFTFTLDLLMAVVGLLMFGDYVHDEITANILLIDGYPEGLSVFIVICIAIIPLTKIPLNARPIVSTLEILFGLDSRAVAQTSAMIGMSGPARGTLKLTIRLGVTVIFILIAIVFPSFDRIMTLLGAVACFTICIILPLAFHLKLFGKTMSKWHKMLDWTLIVISIIMALVSTVFACLPKKLIGA